MNFKDTFIPITEEFPKQFEGKDFLGSSVTFYTETFPDLDRIDLAVIGIYEDLDNSLKQIRQELYKYRSPLNTTHIVDLGDLKQPDKLLLKEIILDLLRSNICPVFIGGNQSIDLTIHEVYREINELLNIAIIDHQIDLGNVNGSGHLSDLLLKSPNHVESIKLIGFQTYLAHQSQFKVFEKLNFETVRLGEIRKNIELVEPMLRSANYCSFDTKAISNQLLRNEKGHFFGLSGEEACQLSWYAGMNDYMKVISFNEYPEDINQSEAQLLATIIWYFIEGVYSRRETYDFTGNLYTKFTASLAETNENIAFFKSEISGKWWFEHEGVYIPCSYQDYLDTVNGELPQRIFKTLF